MSQRLGVLASHPIQYNAPVFRELSRLFDLHVYYAHRQTAEGQAAAGFGVGFEWDVDLFSGYDHEFLPNVARRPDVNRFFGCDTPSIAGKIAAGGYDAFLVTGWYLKAYWQAIRACRNSGVPVMVRGDSRLGSARTRLKTMAKAVVYPHLLRKFDVCLYVGEDSKDYFQHYGVPEDHLFFSPHCVDNAWFSARACETTKAQARKALALPMTGKIALFVGKLVARKRPLEFIEAAALVLRQGVPIHVVVVGDGPLRSSVETSVKQNDVPATFLGFRNQTSLPEIYKASDVLVLPSDGSETWGLVVNEALASGLPVAVSDAVGCARDLVFAGETGATYSMGNVPALAKAMRDVMTKVPVPVVMRGRIERYSARAAALGVSDAVDWLKGRRKVVV